MARGAFVPESALEHAGQDETEQVHALGIGHADG
jgi:hypothetical protein